MTSSKQTKSSLPILIFSICFLLAPIGNIFISILVSKIPLWYHWKTFAKILTIISFMDWLAMTLTFAAGIALLIQHKTSWLIAIFSLLFSTGINIYKIISYNHLIGTQNLYYQIHLGVALVTTLSVLIVIYYFRYPYLDRRSGWLSFYHPRTQIQCRFSISTADKTNTILGTSKSLSIAGMLAHLDSDQDIDDHQWKNAEVSLTDLNMKFLGDIIESSNGILRVSFKSLNRTDKKILTQWIKSN